MELNFKQEIDPVQVKTICKRAFQPRSVAINLPRWGESRLMTNYLAAPTCLGEALRRRKSDEGGSWGMNNHWPDAPASAKSVLGRNNLLAMLTADARGRARCGAAARAFSLEKAVARRSLLD
jgi:hypothetical protein